MKNAIWLFVFSVIVFLVFLPSYTQLQDLKQINRQYEAKITELIQENSDLIEERIRLQEDPEYLEKIARERMGLVREGEVVYKLVPAEKDGKK